MPQAQDGRFVIGLDIGTSGCKCTAVDGEGRILFSQTETYPISLPRPGWSEQDPADWAAGAFTALRAMAQALDMQKALGISFSGQMHGLVALDGNMQVIRPAILWNDQRTEAQCETITRLAGGLRGLLSYTNNMMLTGYTGGKLLWMKEQEPENFARLRLFLNPKDYIRWLLCGQAETEVSDASGTGLFDVKRRAWAWGLIDTLGFDRGVFPPVRESTDLCGHVTEAAAAQTGLPAGLPVYAGGGDAVISTVGMGLLGTGRVGLTLGTSGVVAMCLQDYAENKDGKLQLFCNNLPGAWHAFGCTLSAAGSYDWFCRNFGGEGKDVFARMDALAEQTPPGAEGLVFQPYLSGERCPVFDPNATGSFTGLTLRHGLGHMARAVMEGVAFSLKQVYELIPKQGQPDFIAAAGGGVKGKIWRQILADVFECPVCTVSGSGEGGAFAAALLAGISCGLYPSVEAAMALVREESRTAPVPENFAVYRAAYRNYLALYPALRAAKQ